MVGALTLPSRTSPPHCAARVRVDTSCTSIRCPCLKLVASKCCQHIFGGSTEVPYKVPEKCDQCHGFVVVVEYKAIQSHPDLLLLLYSCKCSYQSRAPVCGSTSMSLTSALQLHLNNAWLLGWNPVCCLSAPRPKGSEESEQKGNLI